MKDRIIEAATKSFSLFGYKATTMDQIAKIAGVGKGTIYTFFSSKEELFTFILTQLVTEMKRIADASIQSDQTFFENLDGVLRKILSYRKDHELFVKLVQEVREIGTIAVREGLQNVEEAIVDYIGKQLEEGIRQRNVKPCNPKLTAFIMLKTYTSLVFEWEQKHGAIGDEEISAVFQLIFSQGLNAES